MKRVFNKSNSFEDAEKWDILQQITMQPEERQKIAAALKKKVYGKDAKDIRKISRSSP